MLEMGEGSVSLPSNHNLKFMSSSRGDQKIMSLSSVESGSMNFQKAGYLIWFCNFVGQL